MRVSSTRRPSSRSSLGPSACSTIRKAPAHRLPGLDSSPPARHCSRQVAASSNFSGSSRMSLLPPLVWRRICPSGVTNPAFRRARGHLTVRKPVAVLVVVPLVATSSRKVELVAVLVEAASTRRNRCPAASPCRGSGNRAAPGCRFLPAARGRRSRRGR